MDAKRDLGDGISIKWEGDGFLLTAEVTGEEPREILLDAERMNGISHFVRDFFAATKAGEVVK